MDGGVSLPGPHNRLWCPEMLFDTCQSFHRSAIASQRSEGFVRLYVCNCRENINQLHAMLQVILYLSAHILKAAIFLVIPPLPTVCIWRETPDKLEDCLLHVFNVPLFHRKIVLHKNQSFKDVDHI